MSENENIEAKLCSYVEGDLDAAGRAEIEQYLLSHPQYRPLIAELSAHVGLLRKLPRASAPAELLETLSGQIERSAPLGDHGPEVMRIHTNRLPHLAAWAAVLLLTGGLAAVIYRVLPSNKTQSELALLKPAPQPLNPATQSLALDSQKVVLDQEQVQLAQVPAAGMSPQVAAAEAAAAPAAPAANTDQLADKALSPTPSDATATTSPMIASANTSSTDGSVFSGATSMTNAASPQQQLLGPIISGDGTQSGQSMYLTLHATDAKLADARVTQYLNDNGIQFESHGVDAGSLISSGPLQPPALSAGDGVHSMNSVASASPNTPPGMSSNAASNASPNLVANGNAIVPIDAAKAEKSAALPMIAARRSVADQAGGARQTQYGFQPAGSVIIARNLSAEQARRLTSDLAVKIVPGNLNPLPALQPVAMDETPLVGAATLQVGQRVRIIAKDNGLPGVEAMNEPQTIDADGNLTLPLVGKLKAAGLTEAQLAEKIPEAYRQAKSPTTATWEIDRVANVLPATDALSLTPSAFAPAAGLPTQPGEGNDSLLLPVDTNGGAAGDHQGIDVTIRVVGQSAATAAPTTQPIPMPNDLPPKDATVAPPIAAPAATMPTSAPAPRNSNLALPRPFRNI